MLDLGTSFIASVERAPDGEAIVDGDLRLTYAEWYARISSLVASFDAMGLKRGDHLVTVLRNRWQAATVHWACQFTGIILTPLNWRAKSEDVSYCVHDAEARAIVYEDAPAKAIAAAGLDGAIRRINLDHAGPDEVAFDSLIAETAPEAMPRVDADAWSLMLYTSGTTSKPKGVPRRHRAERAGAIAHVAQNLYATGERTLGVMPLYHTMGVRSLLASSIINGTFVCMPKFDAGGALKVIEQERIDNLYLVPTLYHDMVHHPDFASAQLDSVRKLGFAGAPMTDGLLKRLQEAFRPELFVNHYGSSEIYTMTIDQDATRKPGSAGRSGINQRVRVVKLGADTPGDLAARGEEGEILGALAGDEAFEGYWRRPEADARALRDGWYFTGDTGYFDEDGDLFVTGRVDDMIITGGENVSPVEIESLLSLHPAVDEVAVVGLPDERWGRLVTAFVSRAKPVTAEELDAYCASSALANFKRPRRFVFVKEIPKSPVGKLLRRKLVSGEYQLDQKDQAA
ncbi:AMP-binding protein [Sphingomonas desiccabilis]|uniref:Long-chain fatty acid--CoA ligase n=1 Tax=Sphingomonas desiccabilis TaxID=429134 RepID=A0A4Q2ITL0_9SPHN|nr:AMP-binding protein [Sphingomonas desiccabilis]MBB3911497.1 2-furoate---CoA ligase [Sphingomonas desiccabilis]RXZ31741.1 long-chain fatty acid--CoA ligase [Sphingomonas desiccabilis]